MLNELEQLRRSLQVNGVQTTAWHPSIKPLAKYLTLLVRLNAQGVPVSVTRLPEDQAAMLRNIQPDNHKSFPAFNLNCPVFLAPEGIDLSSSTAVIPYNKVSSVDFAYKRVKGRIQALERLTRLLYEFPVGEIAPKLSTSSHEPLLASTLRLLEVLTARTQSAEEFIRSFAESLIKAGFHGDIANEAVLEVLFGKLSKKGTREAWQCILYLDLQDIGEYQTAVATREAAAAWSEALLMQSQSGPEQETIQCALDGNSGPSVGDKMPNPTLPLLGGTYLFSMNSEIPCQSRYARSSTSLYPMTRHAVQGITNALLHITSQELRSKTWSPVPSGTNERSDLLIAYIEETPDIEAEVAGTLGAYEEDDADDEETRDVPSGAQQALFVQRLDHLIEAIQMKDGQQLRGSRHLRLFVLSTIDKGRKQVLFDASYSLGNLVAARDRWVNGAMNTPSLDVRLFQGKGKPKKHRSNSIPSPVTVARSFRQLWIRQAERGETVSGVALGRIYKLLLDPNREEADWLLERFLPLKIDLLISAGKPSRDEKTGSVYTYTGAALSDLPLRDLLTSTAVLGILLSLSGRTKDMYMHERDYLLGQLLQFADRLHIVYCHGARGGQVPPQLIGNSLIGEAAQNPAKALAILQQRLPVYERYATQLLNSAEPAVYASEAKGEEARLGRLKHKAWDQAGWIKATLARLASEVHQLGLEPTSGPQGQAELLLGYLAAPAKKSEGK